MSIKKMESLTKVIRFQASRHVQSKACHAEAKGVVFSYDLRSRHRSQRTS
jgi:hypothetical protein